MNQKNEIIRKIEMLINTEVDELKLENDKDKRAEKLDTLYKFYHICENFDELDPVLKKFFKDKNDKEKWGER